MSDEFLLKRKPANRAAKAARVLGTLLSAIAVLICFVVAFSAGSSTWWDVLTTVASVLAVYFAPGFTLIILSNGVRRGSRGPTIASLVIACIFAGLLWFGLAMWGITLARIWPVSFTALAPLGFVAIIAIVATMLAIYCGQSLRFPDREDPVRGFEPLMGSNTSPDKLNDADG